MIKRYSAGVLINGNKILLGLRNTQRNSYPGFWDFIGGHCNETETYEEAMKRELLEEINIVALHYTRFKRFDNSPEFVLELYIITEWLGEPINMDQKENEKIEWFTFEQSLFLEFPNEEYLTVIRSLAASASGEEK